MALHLGDETGAALSHGRDDGAGRIEQPGDRIGERARKALHLADLVDEVDGPLLERERRQRDGVERAHVDAVAADPVRRAQSHAGEPGGAAVETLDPKAQPLAASAPDLVGEEAAELPA